MCQLFSIPDVWAEVENNAMPSGIFKVGIRIWWHHTEAATRSQPKITFPLTSRDQHTFFIPWLQLGRWLASAIFSLEKWWLLVLVVHSLSFIFFQQAFCTEKWRLMPRKDVLWHSVQNGSEKFYHLWSTLNAPPPFTAKPKYPPDNLQGKLYTCMYNWVHWDYCKSGNFRATLIFALFVHFWASAKLKTRESIYFVCRSM